MTLPQSLLKAGFKSARDIMPKHRRLMVCLYGPTDSGKTEVALSAPGPGALIALDRGVEGMLENPNPPPTRNADNFAFHIVGAPLATQMGKDDYIEYWKKFYGYYKTVLGIPEVRTVVLDGDSDSWEVQRLAEFGRLTKVPPNLYDNVNAARRAMYARAYDSGKIFIATNRVRKVYIDKIDPRTGNPIVNDSGNIVRMWNGEYERQGFGDQDYLWQVHCRCYRNADSGEFGMEITKCKQVKELQGYTLEGDECNFQGLVQTIFPEVPLKDWGY